MADEESSSRPPRLEEGPFNRILGATEHNWCRAVESGTGITVLGLLFCRSVNVGVFQCALDAVLARHPRLLSQLVWIEPDKPAFQVNANATVAIQELAHGDDDPEDWLLQTIESEMNSNPWTDRDAPVPVFFARLHRLGEKSLFVIRVHTAACDRAAAAVIMSEFLHRLRGDDEQEGKDGDGVEELVSIEDAIPRGQANKPFWAHGVDLLGYSLGSLRHALLPFDNVEEPRRTELVRASLSLEHTKSLTKRCVLEKTNLFGALVAAGLRATTIYKQLGNRSEHFAIIGLVDCRNHIDSLSRSTAGFYHSAILNTHHVNQDTGFWDLSRRCSDSFSNAIKNRKHFTDMGDINYLMFQALQHPNLTPSGTLRTSLMVVFQDVIADESEEETKHTLGLEDYVGCASVHGVGPSLALFDSIRDGCLHCNVVYPAPLHSREQIRKVVDDMMEILKSQHES
ncbi:hypothetical protein SELMODRAFT_407067 [Selaginella moellendorffii]|uniref:Condensation domain-containing protein n=1 Tax=Selaginella moellendorffii TaxID=88036 RepID=D8R3T6_SELML|nr:uncharacterized protein LOC9634627 [Selaginella moellendorffii]EFJ33342.1 hypothetical protein SELMODRAFT_407067 [Selaginella moellendorffii]|eukprot:XP_002965922.1 uncharacterized protein LOC9634627 [Selaginella moellendorffii]